MARAAVKAVTIIPCSDTGLIQGTRCTLGVPPDDGVDVTASQSVPDQIDVTTESAYDFDFAQYFTGDDVGDGSITFEEVLGTLAGVGLAANGDDLEAATPTEGSVTLRALWSDGVNERRTNEFTISFKTPLTPTPSEDETGPTQVVGLSASAGVGSVTLTHDPASDPHDGTIPGTGVASYRYLRDDVLVTTQAAASAGLSPAYTSGDIGSPDPAGSSNEVGAGGTDVSEGFLGETGTANATRFRYSRAYQHSGNFTRSVRVASIAGNTVGWSRTGIVAWLGELTDPDAPFIMVDFSPSGATRLRAKLTPTGNTTVIGNAQSGATSLWLRLSLSGSLWTAEYSLDGNAWTVIATVTHAPPASFTLMRATCSSATGVQITAVYENDSFWTGSRISKTINTTTGGQWTVEAVDAEGNVGSASAPVGGFPDSPPPVEELTTAQLQAMGYEVVTTWPGVRNDGQGDCLAGLQACHEFAMANQKPVWYPLGTYRISNTLCLYQWRPWNASQGASGGADNSTPHRAHAVYGATAGGLRPVILLAPNASGFNSQSSPRPVVCIRQFEARNSNATGNPKPSHPLQMPAPGASAWKGGAYTVFNSVFCGVDIDCNHNAGAIGLYYPAAQDSWLANVRVDATDAYLGIWGLPGRTMGAINLEVQGGRFGLRLVPGPDQDGIAGAVACGVRLLDQTEAPIQADDFSPGTLVGFHIRPAPGVRTYVGQEAAATSQACMTFVDGIVEQASGIVFDNSVAKNFYARNVYVQGTGQLVKTGANATVTGTGSWKRIVEYAANDPDGTLPASIGSNVLRTSSLVNGTVSQAQQPVVNIESNVAAPPSDLVSRHTITIQMPDTGPFIDIRDHGAVSGPNSAFAIKADYYAGSNASTANARAAIQAAIDAAETAGHNRVFIPRGIWYVGSPGLVLKPHTKLFGTGYQKSLIAIHSSWAPTTGSPYVIDTPSDADGTAQLAAFNIVTPRRRGTGGNSSTPYLNDRFSHIRWRLGRYSSTIGVMCDKEFAAAGIPSNPHINFTITGDGGGKHYFICDAGNNGSNGANFRVLKIDGTTEPCWIYAINLECSKNAGSGSSSMQCDFNCEIVGAQNVRVFGPKREGRGASFRIHNSQNVGIFSNGAMLHGNIKGDWIQITGTSDNVVIANILIQKMNEASTGKRTVIENITGAPNQPRSISWPESLSIYKRTSVSVDAMDAAARIA